MTVPKITLIGAGSTVFIRNVLGGVLQHPALKSAYIALMDIDETQLEESHIMVRKLVDPVGASGEINCHHDCKTAPQGVDFVVVVFQIGGYEPCTVIDFTVCKCHGLERTIADMLGPGGTMRALRIIPYLWAICDDMTEAYPDTTLFNYVNPTTTNTWATHARYLHIRQAGLCHPVQGTAEELMRNLDLDPTGLRYRCAEINCMVFYLSLEEELAGGSYISLYPDLLQIYTEDRAPKPNLHGNPRCENIIRYEMFKELGCSVTESSERFVEYTPWFIKSSYDDLTVYYKVLLDEYPKRCVKQLASWHQGLESYQHGERIEAKPPREYASAVMNATRTGELGVVYGNVCDDNFINNLPWGCCVRVVCLVDANGVQPTKVGELPAYLTALMQININVQMLLTQAILTESRDYVYYAMMMNPHTAAVLGIKEIYALVDDLIASHGDQLPA